MEFNGKNSDEMEKTELEGKKWNWPFLKQDFHIFRGEKTVKYREKMELEEKTEMAFFKTEFSNF